MNAIRLSFFGKTCPASSPAEIMRSGSSLLEWLEQTPPSSVHENADGGRTSVWLPDQKGSRHGVFSTLNTSAWPSAGGGCSSLADVLEEGFVPEQYFLSPNACRGLLRRADIRGRVLPGPLRQALEDQAWAMP